MGAIRGKPLPPSRHEVRSLEIPPLDAPPWACLSKPGVPVVIRRFDAKTRTCEPLGDHGRWLLESCIVARTPGAYISELHLGWELACGDVEPGWCIVYAGHRLWFPQRVVRVELLSEDWQRVWTISDAHERDVWETEEEYDWDNGFKTEWSFDEMGLPRWGTIRNPGPWWPLQSEPLDPESRRFVLDAFGIAVECPKCGEFGKKILYGMAIDVPDYYIPAGCSVDLDPVTYGCECGFAWSVDQQGRAYDPSESPFGRDLAVDTLTDDELAAGEDDSDEEDEGPLNYDFMSAEPYGPHTERCFRDLQDGIWEELGGERDEDGSRISSTALDEHVYGRGYFDVDI